MGLGARIRRARELAGWDQATLAREAGVPQATLSMLETRDSNRSSYSEQLIRALPSHKVNPEWVRTGAGQPEAAPRLESGMASYVVADQQPRPSGDFVLLPRLGLRETEGEAAEPKMLPDEAQAFRADWLRAEGLDPATLAYMVSPDSSMTPAVWEHDALVVDTAQRDVSDGRVYAIWYSGGARVRRLYRLPGGALRIKADSTDFQTIEVAPEAAAHVRVLGRVVHRSGKGGL